MVHFRSWQRIGELSILIHEIVLVSQQEYDHNQLDFQFPQPHTGTRVSAGPPTEERIGGLWDGIRLQPSTRVILLWVGVEFWVQVGVAYRIREEIPAPDDLSAEIDILTNVPSEDGEIE